MKNVIIIGASGTIGIEIVKAYYKKGYNVFAGYSTNPEPLNAFIKRTKPRSNRISLAHIDLTNENSIITFFETAKSIFGNYNALINCAGVSFPSLLMDINKANLDKEIAINLTGVILSCKYALNVLADGASIINIASIWGVCGGAFETTYSATKGGIITFTKALAKEIGSKKITANIISPGLIKSKMNNHLTRQDYADVKNASPLGELATAKDVANCCLFLSSPKARHITGQNITIDSGFIL